MRRQCHVATIKLSECVFRDKTAEGTRSCPRRQLYEPEMPRRLQRVPVHGLVVISQRAVALRMSHIRLRLSLVLLEALPLLKNVGPKM